MSGVKLRIENVGSVRVVLGLLCLATLLGSFLPIVELLGYRQISTEQGEIWRPFTAWVTQLNFRHWLLNQWGVALMALLLPKNLKLFEWLGFAFVWLFSSIALWQSDYDNYVGLSGLLYGWLLWSAALSPYYGNTVKWIFCSVLAIKVFSENGFLPLPQSSWVGDFISANVAYESHLWGLMSGLVLLALRAIAQRFP